MLGKQGEWFRIGVNGGVCEGKCVGCSPEDEPVNMKLLGGNIVCGRAYNLKGIKGKMFLFFLKLFLIYCSSFHGMMWGGASVAEWLEHAVAVREVSGSSPGRGVHKNLCG